MIKPCKSSLVLILKLILKLILNLILFFFGNIYVHGQPDRVTYLDDPSWQVAEKKIDILHLSAELKLHPMDTLVIGSAEFLFTPLGYQTDSFQFYVPDMVFEKVEMVGVPIEFREEGSRLTIFPQAELEKGLEYLVRMKYSSRPKYDLFHIGWREPALRDNKQVWAHRPFHWLPYSDDRLTVDLRITFDSAYRVFSNGVRESVEENSDGTKTWHYTMHREHPFFSTALVIGDYDFLTDTTKSGVPLELWYYPRDEDHAEPTYRYTADMFSFFEEEFGYPYPYELYREAPVEDYLYGAMETTTSTVFGDYLAVDERAWDGRNYVNVNAHELAHQWFGDCMSHLRARDVWLTESFATYYAKMFEKHQFGNDYYDWVRDQEWIETMEASGKDGYPVGHSRGGRARWYPKGSLVLDMLRDVLGDEGFKSSIRHYLEKNAFSEVETGEFLAAIREATGRSMEWFFEQWIFRGGEPHYQVGWYEINEANGNRQTIVEVRQIHKRDDLVGLFTMPVNIEVYYDDGSSQHARTMISEEWHQVKIANLSENEVAFVLFDPGRRVLKKISFDKNLKELSAQLLGAPLMIDRYDALLALRDYPLEEKKEVLAEAWKKEMFHLTRGEILRQMGPENLDGWQDDPDPLVRRAVIESVDRVPGELKEEFERFLSDFSYINVGLVLDLLCRSFPKDTPRYLETTKGETGWRGRNIRMKWLEIAIGAGQREYLSELVDYAGPHYEFETRINAFQVLKRLNYMNDVAASHLIDGYLYWNYKVSNAAREVLIYFLAQNNFRRIIENIIDNEYYQKEEKAKLSRLLN